MGVARGVWGEAMSAPARLTLAGHTFVVTPTQHYGINTGRLRYRVECETCGTVEHEATTGAAERIRSHIVWTRAGDEALLLSSVVHDALAMAQAAVGAPVLPPRADGEPAPLWEWVRAAEESALGLPDWSVLDARDTDQPMMAAWPAVFVRIDITREHTVWAGPPIQRFFGTPAELRAALDALAKEVKP